MNLFKTIRRVGAISLLVYGLYKVGGCSYRTYGTFRDEGVKPAIENGVNEIGTYLKKCGERLEEVGGGLEKIKPEKREKEPSELEKELEQQKDGSNITCFKQNKNYGDVKC